MKNDETTHGENEQGAKVLIQSFSIPLGIKNGIATLLPKQKSTAMALKALLPALFVLNVFGMLLLLMSSMASGAVCRTEKETLLLENGRRNTQGN